MVLKIRSFGKEEVMKTLHNIKEMFTIRKNKWRETDSLRAKLLSGSFHEIGNTKELLDFLERDDFSGINELLEAHCENMGYPDSIHALFDLLAANDFLAIVNGMDVLKRASTPGVKALLIILKNGDNNDREVLARLFATKTDIEKKIAKETALTAFRHSEARYFNNNPSQNSDRAMISRR